jgi:aminoglycoside/choline kinase family phosphotransferase
MVDELEAVPVMTVHGDACSRNLLVRRDGRGFSLIDFSFWSKGPVGFDLGQLLVGEVQTGQRPARELAELEAACVPAYVDGLGEEGADVRLGVVQRAHALQAVLFAGLSAVPLEHLCAVPTPELHRIAGERAQLATFLLDLVDATA